MCTGISDVSSLHSLLNCHILLSLIEPLITVHDEIGELFDQINVSLICMKQKRENRENIEHRKRGLIATVRYFRRLSFLLT